MPLFTSTHTIRLSYSKGLVNLIFGKPMSTLIQKGNLKVRHFYYPQSSVGFRWECLTKIGICFDRGFVLDRSLFIRRT